MTLQNYGLEYRIEPLDKAMHAPKKFVQCFLQFSVSYSFNDLNKHLTGLVNIFATLSGQINFTTHKVNPICAEVSLGMIMPWLWFSTFSILPNSERVLLPKLVSTLLLFT